MTQEAPAPFPCEVIILTALAVEYQAIIKHLQEPREIVHPQGTIYRCGRFIDAQSSWQVAVAEIGVRGSVAAVETERAITFFHPDFAFFVGIAGGLQDVQIGDVVVATKVYGYEAGKAGQSFEPRPELWRATHTLEQRARAEARIGDWLERLGIARPDPAPRVFVAPIAAGEKIIASRRSSLRRFLRQEYGDALAVEMEGHGFSQAVHANQGVSSLVVRGISNLLQYQPAADASASQQTAARHAAAFVFQILAKMQLPANHHIPPAREVEQNRAEDDPSPLPASSEPVWSVPFARNPFFTGREQELTYLYEQLHQRHTVAVGQTQSISGLGGIGKTQLAVEYAYRHRREYTYVLWARAESIEALNASYAACAAQLDLPEQHAQEQDIVVQAVKTWFQKHRSWLFILDSADEPGILVPFLPSSDNGHLLLTTRAADLTSLGMGLTHSLAMDPLPPEQSAYFLLQRAHLLALHAPLDASSSLDYASALQIAHELGNLPLALDQAGAYLAATGTSLPAYLSLYQQHRPALLKENRNHAYTASVATTWNLSFVGVEEKAPAAAELLRVCALLDLDAIPEEILTRGAEFLGPVLSPVATDNYLLSLIIEALYSYSLVRRIPGESTLTIHRLVQAVLRDLMGEAEQQRWAERAMLAVNAAFPDTAHGNWSQCERLLPSALAAIELIERYQLSSAAAGRLLYQTALYLQNRPRPRYTQAEPLYQSKESERDADVSHMLNNLAHLYQRQETEVQADPPLHLHALGVLEQLLGLDYADLAPLSGLAELYREQGKYALSEELYRQSLHVLEQQLGSEHPDLAFPLDRLADLYREQGKYMQAEPLYKRALGIWEQQLGAKHPLMALFLNNLANLYYAQGQYVQAELLYLQSLSICEQPGLQHSFQQSIQTIQRNYASLLRDSGFKQA